MSDELLRKIEAKLWAHEGYAEILELFNEAFEERKDLGCEITRI